MASRGLQMVLVLVLAAMFWGGAAAQSYSNTSCNDVIITLVPCVNYLTGNSSTPSNSCCSQLGSVAKSFPDCLCAALNGSVPSTGIKNVNGTIALSLSDACQVQTSIEQCKQAITPTASPPSSPSTTRPSSVSTTVRLYSGSSNTTTPPASRSVSTSTTQDSSDGGIRRAPIHFVLFLLFVASCASTITKL